MKSVIHSAVRIGAVAIAVALAACSDADRNPIAPTAPHRLVSGGSETLSTGTNLSVSNAVTYTVQMPSSGHIYLTFDGRINSSATAGNGSVLELTVNGVAVTTNALLKGPTYTYPNRGGTEYYYDNRGAGYSLWGLFWSPDFSSNNNSSDYYYVQGGNAYSYTYDITSLVNLGQANNIKLQNSGGWTNLSPVIVLQNISVSNS